MLSLDFIADSLDGDRDLDDLSRFDINHDGIIDGNDCPFLHGSPEAKLWWKNIIEPSILKDIPEDMQAKYGDKLVGMYKGRALVPGEAGAGQGDFSYLVDKIKITQGLSHASATKVAAKVKCMLFGG